MVASLPQSIGAYLQEAGFSATELLIIRKLLDDTALTLREMAAKTGKSTGVLDQACKKLASKKILLREQINGTRKYRLASVDAIAKWVREDMLRKRDALHRRQQDFESFLSSVEVRRDRPELEHFEGADGIQRAYTLLLEQGDAELLRYLPITCKEEDDPMRAFRTHFFHERRKRKIFSRILAEDTSLARRYQSRDHLEQRKTVLVPQHSLESKFEKVIAGDIVACIDHQGERAVFIRYAELAAIERGLFEVMWNQHVQPTDSAVRSNMQTRGALHMRFLSVLRGGNPFRRREHSIACRQCGFQGKRGIS